MDAIQPVVCMLLLSLACSAVVGHPQKSKIAEICNGFTCANGKCVNQKLVCNNVDDCGENSDELNCFTKTCTAGSENACPSNNGFYCIMPEDRCDGYEVCLDGSDEKGCQEYVPPKTSRCLSGKFECSDGTCIKQEYVCDGYKDCDDGADETLDICKKTCHSEQFQCRNKECIPGHLICNGIRECSDGSDEDKCLYRCDPQTQFSCGGKSCISLSLVCDGRSDCPKGEDEHWDECQRNGCLVNNGGCSHSCGNTLDGFHCECRPGYKLMEDGKNCDDIDECKNPRSCSQICHNLEGTFKCECEDGYLPDPQDHTRCIAKEGHALLLFAHYQDIRKISLDNYEMTAIIKYTKIASALDFVFRTGIIFWNDVQEKNIYKTPIDNGSAKIVVIKDDMTIFDRIAVDWIYNNIYWTNSDTKTIQVANLHGEMRKVLIADGLQKPRGLAVNPLEGWMFWTNCGKVSKIERAGLDGSHRETIVSDGITWPNGLTLDLVRRRVYWLDAMLHSISSSDYDGAKRRIILHSTNTLIAPVSISVFENHMYWTEWQTKNIYMANKFNGSNVKPITDKLIRPIVLHVYHPDQQPDGVNYCATVKGQCSHLCLPAPQINSSSPKVSCACPDGQVLMADQLTCLDICNEFTCANGKCVNQKLVCNNVDDCGDNSDELNCSTKTCTADSGNACPIEDGYHCITIENLCDGYEDCSDGSDEKDCEEYVRPKKSGCLAREFNCSDGTCIEQEFVCDGTKDCPDGADESLDKCKNTCHSEQFQCKNKECIRGHLICNGIKECSDGSDEEKCMNKCDPQTQFSCGGKSCISLSLVCDGRLDCLKGEDEHWDECKRNRCILNNGGCSHTCVNTLDGFHCECRPGYKLMEDGKNCEDIDECKKPGSCSQICYNLEGTFKCKCKYGYSRDPNNHTLCIAREGQALLLFAQNQDIRKLSLDDYEMTSIIEDTQFASALDFKFSTGIIFWNDVKEKKIYKTPIDNGSARKVIIKDEMTIFDSIAVDWIYNHIYWTNSVKKSIQLANFRGGMRKVLIAEGLDEPRGLAISPLEGWMFWTNRGNDPKINRAGLDGSHIETIVSNNIKRPNGLTLDLVSRRVYWVDANLNSISSCAYDGAERRLILNSVELLESPFSISVFEENMYWTDWETKNILYRANKFNGSNVKPITDMIEKTVMLHVYHPDQQPYGVNYCGTVNGHCSHLCLPAPQINSSSPKVSCACADGLVLMADRLTCSRSNHKNY